MLRAYNYDNIIPIVSSEDGFKEYVEDDVTGFFVFENENPKSLSEKMYKSIMLSDDKKNALRNQF